ncbi:uncharacterized protein LOC115927418 [Strongylocentrotus purpuratus]|uniref:DDE Tnp4 domain-containing protein n=1 Tax=Strongylocentrotus purpuratus TaxID=7668 RepID=A0A7M7PBY8_STRPU|nr:uncharacterized protein LOC115927418 [Strongylocentrotus purpuratus]
MFDDLLVRLTPHLQKKDTHFRKSIPPGLKLSVFLCHLATGATSAELSYNFRVGKETIQKFVPGDFEARRNLPYCLGAYDGKHFHLQKPNKSGSLYFNYKQFFSVVLMALVDSKYQFMWIDVSGVGHQSDAQIYNNTPYTVPLRGRTYIMKPSGRCNMDQQQKIFNWLSRARRVVENAFGILAL